MGDVNPNTRERIFLWIARKALRLANRYAEPFQGSAPYWLLVPSREPEADIAPHGNDEIGV